MLPVVPTRRERAPPFGGPFHLAAGPGTYRLPSIQEAA